MKKSFNPRVGNGWTPYGISNYMDFMSELKGSTPVSFFKEGTMPTRMSATHHIEPEGVTIVYDCTEHSTGQTNLELHYYGNKKSISAARSRVRKLEKVALSAS